MKTRLPLRLLRGSVVLLIAGYALAIVALQLLWRTSALNVWWLSLLNVFGLWLYAPLPFLFLLGVLARPRWTVAALLVPLLCFGWEYAPPMHAETREPTGVPLRVMTWNVLFFNQDIDAIEALIREHDPDVLALQEFSVSQASAFVPVLESRYPYRALSPGGARGLGVYSRYPIENWNANDERISGCSCQRMVLDVGAQKVRLINAHPLAPRFSFRRSLGGLRLPREVLSDFITAHQQPALDILAAEAARAGEPLILVGDLNTGDRQPNYWRLRRYLTDAHHVAGRGFGLTFPNLGMRIGRLRLPPLVRIDYILHSPAITALHATTSASPSSDHRAVVADLWVPAQAQAHAIPSTENIRSRQ